ncbi:MAG: glycosyltransferase, partial [Patescibacteria group bacterium]
ADLVIGSSFEYIQASDARRHFETHKEKWMELPFGVDLERFAPRERSKHLMGGLLPDSSLPVLLFVGGMDEAHYFKGIPVLLRALFLLKKDGIDFSCLFVGDGSLRIRWEQEANLLGLSESVRFVGRVADDELPLYYNLADLFVLPSIHQGEAFGMVLLEAMASGVPVIATNLPGVRNIAERGGVVVPPRNPVALAGRIAEFFIQENDQDVWRRRCRRVAEEQYAWGPIVERLEEEYERLVADRSGYGIV